jgi:hypothetical protein
LFLEFSNSDQGFEGGVGRGTRAHRLPQ